METVSDWLLERLVCPQDKERLVYASDTLTCTKGHEYRIVNGIPVMLFDDGQPTHGYITRSLQQVEDIKAGKNPEDVLWMPKDLNAEVDEFVQAEIPYTCGNLYIQAQHNLPRYPFPEIRLLDGTGKTLVDVGCNWGRWTIAAAALNYRVAGIDPSLDAVTAAKRIAKQLNRSAEFAVADARYLPFADDAFDVGFSNGVLQHLRKKNVKTALRELGRVTKEKGQIQVQMPNKYGVRSFITQVRQGFKDGKEGGGIIYWTPSELLATFREYFGQTALSADCYFGLNNQKSDIDLMPTRFKAVIQASEALRKVSKVFTPLNRLADSVYLNSVNQKAKAK